MSCGPILIDKKELSCLYERKKLTSYEIAGIYNCCQATVWKRLNQYSIKRFPNGRRSIIVPKLELVNFYLKKRLSSRKIAKFYNCAYSAIDTKIKKYGLPVRNIAEAHIVYGRENFSGGNAEKAYLIGFAMGDLRIRKKGKNSETINVDCGSTKKAQIDLIHTLFKPYGRVWISKPDKRGATQIECFLNESFDFLLKRRILIDSWISKNKKYFLNFLAGFTDAEGSIFISNNQAIFSLGNYNHRLLRQIRNKLKKFNIKMGNIVCDNLKGYKGKEGYSRKANYYHFTCVQKTSLEKLLYILRPFLKHADKKNALELALNNIKVRNRLFGF
ncbi:MAG: LAGLIDADG family homing endonuclease [bacterium]|nr:LAGLIDADG family homing endonuclease [bacterium]